jgi:hypothetical protein
VTFTGTDIVGGSLADGVYDLTVIGSKVHSGTAGGPAMANDQKLTFHRLFGDINGSKNVNAGDYNAFRQAFGKNSTQTGFDAAFDFEGNGTVNAGDYNQFRRRFGKSFVYT